MNLKICLERGHGPFKDRFGVQGFERGANGPDTTEYDELVIMSNLCAEVLQAKGYKVTVLDPVETLDQIGRMAVNHDVFVSLHLNAFNKEAQGSEVLIHRNGTKEDEKLAEVLVQEIVQTLKLPNRGVKRSGLAVLSTVPQDVKAACLTEAFFIDAMPSAEACRELTKKAAHAIAEGIDKYCKKTLKRKDSVSSKLVS